MKSVELQRCAGGGGEVRGPAARGAILVVTDTMRDQGVAQALMGAALVGEDPGFEGERVYGRFHVSTGSNATFPEGTVRPQILWMELSATPPYTSMAK